MSKILSATLLLLFFALHLFPQCISSFPYFEDFETNNGNWISGGTGNDWAWGQVSKSVISQAASGSNCWVQGGLVNSFYNLGERSYLQSPCFDFSTLQYPYISFQIFWESERTYDGSNLQYSINGGTTWINVGAYNEPANCMTQNWYNTPNITNLNNLVTVKEGWTGNVQPTQGSCQGGNGSNGWKLAKHCLGNLAGEPNVIFRFTFGAGTACNAYDGIAFDDITIGEAPANTATVSFTCNGNAVTFLATTTGCPDNVQWNFDDGGTANGLTATHIYQSPGVYNVTFTAAGPCNAPAVIVKQVEIPVLTALVNDVTCFGGNDGNATVIVNSANGPFSYEWSTFPVQTTDSAFNLAAGVYTVTVSGGSICTSTLHVTVSEPQALSVSFNALPDTCFTGTGTLTAAVTGGISPYQFVWSNSATFNPVTQLTSGNYQVTVSDNNNCSVTAVGNVPSVSGISIVFTGLENASCLKENDGKVTALVSGGSAPYQYLWSNGVSADKLNGVIPDVYSVTVTDANHCSNTASVEIEKENCESYVYFPTAFSPNGDGINDLFKPKYSFDLKRFSLRVYNRWGEEVFATTDVNEGWNGWYKNMEQPIGVYTWTSEYSFANGKKQLQSGNVTLMR